MSGRGEFDYAGMAGETEAALRKLEEGLARVKSERPREMDGQLRKNTRINLLEEEIMEQRSLLRLFRQRARERGQIPECNGRDI